MTPTTPSMKKTITLIKETFLHWQDKRASRMGAAISFYAIFSIPPLFILLIGIARTIFDKATTNMTVARALYDIVGSNLANVIQSLINSAYHSHNGLITTIIGGVVLIIAALSVFTELNNDLDELWALPSQEIEDRSAGESIAHYFREKLVTILLILICACLLILSIAFTVFISFFHHILPLFLQNQIVTIAISLLGGTILFGLIYHILPETKLPWREVLWGAFVTSILFLIGRFLITWYIEAFGGTSAYGAAGSTVGLLLWIYYSAQVFFIGAAGTFAYSSLYGHLSKKKTVN